MNVNEITENRPVIETENVNDPEEVPPIEDQQEKEQSRKRPSQSEQEDSDDFVLPKIPKRTPKETTAAKKKSSKLIIDKTTKFPSKQMEKQLNYYGDLMVAMPRETFEFVMLDIKMNVERFANKPLHRMYHSDLLHLYQRNLKRVPLNYYKNKANANKQRERRQTRSTGKLKITEKEASDFVPIVHENQPILQDIEEFQLPPVVQENLLLADVQQNLPIIPNEPPIRAQRRKITFDGSQTYNEK